MSLQHHGKHAVRHDGARGDHNGAPGEDKGVKEMERDGTTSPKLNVLVGAEELNWRQL